MYTLSLSLPSNTNGFAVAAALGMALVNANVDFNNVGIRHDPVGIHVIEVIGFAPADTQKVVDAFYASLADA